jgi:hypothetical protein
MSACFPTHLFRVTSEKGELFGEAQAVHLRSVFSQFC